MQPTSAWIFTGATARQSQPTRLWCFGMLALGARQKLPLKHLNLDGCPEGTYPTETAKATMPIF